MGGKEISDFLTYLVVHRDVSPVTQNQALCGIVFLYKQVLSNMSGTPKLMTSLFYGNFKNQNVQYHLWSENML